MIPTRRRWYQFGLVQFLIVTTIVGIAWWQAARWPVIETFDLAGPPPGRIGAAIRPPYYREIAGRGLWMSAVIVVVWLGGGAAWNAVRSRRQ